MRAGRERRMPDNGLGVGVAMVRIAVHDARLPQVAEAAFAQAIVVAGRQVSPQLVDCDLQNEFRLVAGKYRRRKQESRNNCGSLYVAKQTIRHWLSRWQP